MMTPKIPVYLDLHGLTTQQGFNKASSFVRIHSFAKKHRHIKIITGVTGRMRREFEHWMHTRTFNQYIKSWKEFDNHGSFILELNH